MSNLEIQPETVIQKNDSPLIHEVMEAGSALGKATGTLTGDMAKKETASKHLPELTIDKNVGDAVGKSVDEFAKESHKGIDQGESPAIGKKANVVTNSGPKG